VGEGPLAYYIVVPGLNKKLTFTNTVDKITEYKLFLEKKLLFECKGYELMENPDYYIDKIIDEINKMIAASLT
jgi:hypothetical protein